MEFESLKYFFNNELSIKISTIKEIEAEYIYIHSIENNKVVFSDFEANSDEKYITGTVSENDALKLRNAINQTLDYFAKVIEIHKEYFVVSIISFNKMPLDAKISIGIGDLDVPFSKVMQNIENEYILNIANKKYYIYGLHNNAPANVFSIMSTSKKYDVILSRRGECGAVLDKETINEQIWAIRKNEQKYKKEDYIFQVRPYNILLNDVSTANTASEQNKLEMIRLNESGILGRWLKFTEEDFKISCEKINKVGVLEYTSYIHTDENRHVFTITNDQLRLENLKNLISDCNSTLTFEVYNNLQEINNSRRRPAKPRFISLIGNKLTCFYDGDIIIKNEGYLVISNAGSQMIYNRRMDAINRIKRNFAAKTNIIQLIEGKALHHEETKKRYDIRDFEKVILESFGGRKPNDAQNKAIEIAINSPDIVVIQGPPGCGKTSLINAIDSCLAIIDSTYHRRAASLSTAYQRESTKNMVYSKSINGVPVPFVSKSEDNIYIENNFMDYINDIADKLKQLYPDIIAKLNNKTIIDVLTSYISRFNPDNATYGSLLSFLDKIFECLKDEMFFDEKDRLNKIYETASKQWQRSLNPNRNEALYFIRIIPGSEIEFEDEGMSTFNDASIYLKMLDPSLNKYIKKIQEMYANNPIDFASIKSLKNEMIFKIKNIEQLDKNIELNEEALNIVYEIKEQLEISATYDNESVLTQYIDAFINNPVRVRQALEQWVTSVAATHQISSDNAAIGQFDEDDEDDDNCMYVVYNNVLIDEAARSCPPDLLIPMACAKNRIIMVGDHKQLPQFVNDEVLERIDVTDDIKAHMKDVSMFEYLIETTKKLEKNDFFKRFIALNEQYRMPKVLGDFIGENFYAEIGLGSPRGNPCDDPNFIQTLPYISNKCMLWCDVPYGKELSVRGKGWKNEEEAKIVSKMLNEFLNDKDNEKLSIGVISFYKDQVNEIKNKLIHYNIYVEDTNGMRINDAYKKRLQIDTVDAFQGLECDIIILSMVRSNTYNKFKKNSFGFLRDERHLCVALSRQKRCLVVVGNGSGMLETEVAESSVKALANYYKKCKEGGDYVGFIDSKTIV